MTLIMKEEEFNAVKQFCDEHQISYREFFTAIAPNLLRENQELRKTLTDKDTQINDITAKYNGLVDKYNSLLEKYKQLKGEHEGIAQEYENLLNENNQLKAKLSQVSNEYNDTKAKLQTVQTELSKANSELSRVRELFDIILKGHVEVEAEYCPKLEQFGFKLVQKEVNTGFMKKSVVNVCVNS